MVTILDNATLVQVGARYLLAEIPSPPPVIAGTGDWFLTVGYDFGNGTTTCLVAARWSGTQLDFGDSIIPPPPTGSASWNYDQYAWGNDGLSYVQQNYSYDATAANNGGFTVYTANQDGSIRTEAVTVPDLPAPGVTGPWHRYPPVSARVGNMVALYSKPTGVNANDWIVYTYSISRAGAVTSLATVTGSVPLSASSGVQNPSQFSNGRVDVAPNIVADVAASTYIGVLGGVDYGTQYSTRAVDLTNPLAFINCTALVDTATGNYWARNGDVRSDYGWYYPTAHMLPSGHGFTTRASDGIVRYQWTGSDFSLLDVTPIQPPPQGGPDWGALKVSPMASGLWVGLYMNPASTTNNLYYNAVDPQWSALLAVDGDSAHGITGPYYGGYYFFEPIAGQLLVAGVAADFGSASYYQLGYLPQLVITGQIDQTRVRPYNQKRLMELA